jgi:D-alanyl-D-alanine dipeptidase
MNMQVLPESFVILNHYAPMLQIDLKYCGEDNLIGRPLEGYPSKGAALLTKIAADSLIAIYQELQTESLKEQLNMDSPTLLIWDSYRPQMSVDDFWTWAQSDDSKTKAAYYPRIDKLKMFELGYIARKSGHSRGSTIDLTIVDRDKGYLAVDMGTPFDFMDELSHPNSTAVPESVFQNRQFLKSLMKQFGWVGIEQEWWHYTFANEPFPDTYFNFPILNINEYQQRE